MFPTNVIYLLTTGTFERHDFSTVSPLAELDDTGPALIIKYVDCLLKCNECCEFKIFGPKTFSINCLDNINKYKNTDVKWWLENMCY